METIDNRILQQLLDRTSPEAVVTTLLELEKSAKKDKQYYSLQQLCGTWRLYFITGTKKTRQKAGIVLGAGRYLPEFIKIKLRYSIEVDSAVKSDLETGKVENSVEFAGLQLILAGRTKFLATRNILVFDFTKIEVRVGGLSLYRGYIRGGESKEKEFVRESVSKQAFFSYFLVSETAISARGRGGGLALWRKAEG
jgi:hypothetical protein